MRAKVSVFLSAVAAGACIALGGTVYLRVKSLFPGGQAVGALLFAIGLFVICWKGFHLFTGRVCTVFFRGAGEAALLPLIWAGNLCGATLIALAERATVLCGGAEGIDAAAAALVQAKMASPLSSLFLLGALCNVCIWFAVNGFATIPDAPGRYLALFLGVAVFLLSGMEHSVADMYYWALSGTLFAARGASLARLGVITLGNACGGVLFPLAEAAIRRLAASGDRN